MQHPPDLLLFIGRFHPLVVHLPIGMLVAAAILELAAWLPRFKNANASAGFLIAMAALSAALSAVCGWFLSLAGGYDATLLAWHKWLGIATATGSVTAALLFYRRKLNLYRAVLFVSTGLLMIAGHLGGSLTHGSDYLGKYAPGPLKKILGASGKKTSAVAAGPSVMQSPVFASVVAPILEKKCIECHGAAKSKGDLRLDSFALLMKGGENGVVIRPGEAAGSPLVQRLLLPVESDDHMPPDGKPQLSAKEIALLKWWIDAGAPESSSVESLHPPSEIVSLLTGDSAPAN